MPNASWLPEGLRKNLHVEHAPSEGAGAFTGGGWKLDWHTTESNWDSVDAMRNVLQSKRAAPHFVIGGRAGTKLPVVIQMVGIDQAARALGNFADGFDTNRANCIQVEICWRAGASKDLKEWHYKALANLTRLINEALPKEREIPRRLARKFSNDARFTDAAFVKAEGHLGHKHTPDNDHWDPGPDFRGQFLLNLLCRMPAGGFDLS